MEPTDDKDNEDCIPIFIGVFINHIKLSSPNDGVHIDLNADQARAIGQGLIHAADILDDLDEGFAQGGKN